MQAACFSMDIYCDVKGCTDGVSRTMSQFTGNTYSSVRGAARAAGWRVAMPGSNDPDLCPHHKATP